jgi:hypothetical protein
MSIPNTTPVFTAIGPNPEKSRLGATITGIGDINGDGVKDFAAGAPEADSAGIANLGTVFIYRGQSGAAPVLLQRFDPPTTAFGLGFGDALAGGVDVNRDGYSDMVVGIPKAGSNAGGILVIRGTKLGPKEFFAFDTLGTGRIGKAVAMGNVNSDLYGDIVVGAPSAGNIQGSEGFISVFPGRW